MRRNVADTVKRLQKEIPGIRIAVIAHGDYCDSYTYITKILPFTSNVDEIVKFVETVQCTGMCHTVCSHCGHCTAIGLYMYVAIATYPICTVCLGCLYMLAHASCSLY